MTFDLYRASVSYLLMQTRGRINATSREAHGLEYAVARAKRSMDASPHQYKKLLSRKT